MVARIMASQYDFSVLTALLNVLLTQRASRSKRSDCQLDSRHTWRKYGTGCDVKMTGHASAAISATSPGKVKLTE